MKVGTHGNEFHADEVVGMAILRMLYAGMQVVRTRDEAVLSGCDVILDVGAKYDPKEGRFDHHQGGIPARPSGVPYASAGLIWRHYGQQLCSNTAVFEHVDAYFIAPIDAMDCGMKPHGYVDGAYEALTLSQILLSLNPTREEGREIDPNHDRAFKRALRLAEMLLDRAIAHAEAALDDEAQGVFAEASTLLDGGAILVLDQERIPWNVLVYTLDQHIRYVVEWAHSTWMVYAVPTRYLAFSNRGPMPTEWAGLRGDELQQITGVEDAVFCHTGRFCGGAASREGAIALARLALSAE